MVLNAVGTMGEVVVLGWLALELTSSPFLVGVALGMRALPLFFVGAPAGVLADRGPAGRRRLAVARGRRVRHRDANRSDPADPDAAHRLRRDPRLLAPGLAPEHGARRPPRRARGARHDERRTRGRRDPRPLRRWGARPGAGRRDTVPGGAAGVRREPGHARRRAA